MLGNWVPIMDREVPSRVKNVQMRVNDMITVTTSGQTCTTKYAICSNDIGFRPDSTTSDAALQLKMTSTSRCTAQGGDACPRLVLEE